jgi:hypothetical protein
MALRGVVMSNKKLLEDRILEIQKYCAECHIDLDMTFDPVNGSWSGWDQDQELTGPVDSFEGLVEALEAEFQL